MRKASIQDGRLGTANSAAATSGRNTRLGVDDFYPTPPSTSYSKVRTQPTLIHYTAPTSLSVR